MYSGLINQSLLKSNLLIDTINNTNIPNYKINYTYLIINYILPLLFFIFLCFYLKQRYTQKYLSEKKTLKNNKKNNIKKNIKK